MKKWLLDTVNNLLLFFLQAIYLQRHPGSANVLTLAEIMWLQV